MLMRHPEILDDVTLYDVMYEQGTQLGGAIIKLWSMARDAGDTRQARKWLDERISLQSEREKIDPHDRQAMIAAYDRWNGREMILVDEINQRRTVNAAQ